MSDKEENKLVEKVFNVFRRLRPRLISEYSLEKSIEKRATEIGDNIRQELVYDFNKYDEKEDNEDVRTDESFYELMSEEEDDAYSQIGEAKIDKKNKDKKSVAKKVMEIASQFLINRGIISTSGSLIERRQPREIREQVQAAMYIKSFEDPIVKSVVGNFRRYVQGRGVRFHSQIPDVQERLEDFWKENNMPVKEKTIMHNGIAESEVFLVHWIDGTTGKIKLRMVSPGEITRVETDPEDSETLLSYTREFFMNQDNDDIEIHTDTELKKKIYADIDYYIQLEGSFSAKSKHDDGKVTGKPSENDEWQGPFRLMQFEKLGNNREVRSRVMLQPILKWAKIYTNWVKDRAVLNHERARVVWILTVQGKLNETLLRHKIAPSSGTVKVETEQRKWRTEAAHIDAHEAKDDGRSLMNQISMGADMPVSVWAQIVDDAVYASIKKADTPFSQMVLDTQDRWSSIYKRIFQVVISSAVKYGKLDDKFKVQKFLQEHHKKAFIIQKQRFEDGEIDAVEMIRTLKEITRDFLIDIQWNKVFQNSPKAQKIVSEQCIELMESFDSGIEEAYGKNDFEIGKVMKEFAVLYEKGVEVEVNAIDVPIDIIFPQVVTEDPLSQSKTLLILQKIGVSRTTLLRVAGYDPEREASLRAIEKEEGTFEDLDDLLNPNSDKFNSDGTPPDLKQKPGAGGATADKGGEKKPAADKK